jgi:hypothetical protein
LNQLLISLKKSSLFNCEVDEKELAKIADAKAVIENSVQTLKNLSKLKKKAKGIVQPEMLIHSAPRAMRKTVGLFITDNHKKKQKSK